MNFVIFQSNCKLTVSRKIVTIRFRVNFWIFDFRKKIPRINPIYDFLAQVVIFNFKIKNRKNSRIQPNNWLILTLCDLELT